MGPKVASIVTEHLMNGRHRLRVHAALLVGAALLVSACVPLPVSSVRWHPRQERPAAVESAAAAQRGLFSALAFDASGGLLAAYDSGADRVRVLRSADLGDVDGLRPSRVPRRLSFSPRGRYLVIEAHAGWIGDVLRHGAVPVAADIGAHEATRDAVERVAVWNLRTGQVVADLRCDAEVTSPPEAGWLWARSKAIVPGYRSSALLEAHFSADEGEFSVLCWNGVQQRWDARTWSRLPDRPPPPFWEGLMGLTTAHWLAGNDGATRSGDGRIAVLRVREKSLGFGTTYVWDRQSVQARRLPGECAARLQPVYALSDSGTTLVVACNKDLGYALRVWDLASGLERPLDDAEFGWARGVPVIRGAGVALSPDGRFVAAALLDLMEALVITPVPLPLEIQRSDLRLWRVDSGREVVSVSIDDLVAGADPLRGVALAFSPDTSLLAVGGRRLRLYRLRDLQADAVRP